MQLIHKSQLCLSELRGFSARLKKNVKNVLALYYRPSLNNRASLSQSLKQRGAFLAKFFFPATFLGIFLFQLYETQPLLPSV